jgi:hypothetical protein
MSTMAGEAKHLVPEAWVGFKTDRSVAKHDRSLELYSVELHLA